MQLTREVLEADRKAYLDQARGAQQLVQYIDGLLVFLEKPEPVQAVPEAPVSEEEKDESSS